MQFYCAIYYIYQGTDYSQYFSATIDVSSIVLIFLQKRNVMEFLMFTVSFRRFIESLNNLKIYISRDFMVLPCIVLIFSQRKTRRNFQLYFNLSQIYHENKYPQILIYCSFTTHLFPDRQTCTCNVTTCKMPLL